MSLEENGWPEMIEIQTNLHKRTYDFWVEAQMFPIFFLSGALVSHQPLAVLMWIFQIKISFTNKVWYSIDYYQR